MPNTLRFDLTNQRFGRWLVIEKHSIQGKWLCRCECGIERPVRSIYLRRGSSTSCGCAMPGLVGNALRTHGRSSSLLYFAWAGMKKRCQNPAHTSYASYGGRGIKVCERWEKFENFLADMGERPLGPERMTLERRNNDGNYCKENCYWTSYKVQANNQRPKKTSVYITHEGRTMNLKSWERETGLAHSVIQRRIQAGWTVNEALTIPSQKRPHC